MKFWWWLCLGYILSSPAHALSAIQAQFKLLSGQNWQIKGLLLTINHLDRSHWTLDLHMDELRLFDIPLQTIHLHCQQVQPDSQGFSCEQATLQIKSTLFKQSWSLSLNYQPAQQQIQGHSTSFADGEATTSLQLTPDQWEFNLKLRHIDLNALLNPFYRLFTPWQIKGRASLDVQISRQKGITQVTLAGQVQMLSYSNALGDQAGENLNLELNLQAQQWSQQWQGDLEISLGGGEVYADPIYFNLQTQPKLQLTTRFAWTSPNLQLYSLQLAQDSLFNLQGTTQITVEKSQFIQQLNLHLTQGQLKPFYDLYLSSWLGSQYQISGQLEGYWTWTPDQQQVKGYLSQVNIVDEKQALSLQNLNGQLQWHSDYQDPLSSHLYWKNGYLGNPQLQLGPSELHFHWFARQLHLLQPWRQSLLGGEVQIQTLKLQELGHSQWSWQLANGSLTSLSLAALGQIFGGPKLNGNLSGILPELSYQTSQLTASKPVKLNLWDGQVSLENLKILWEEVPELTADLQVETLNLEALTQVTEFGEIRGDLSGYVRDLQLINWRPVTFDAYFSTPKHSRFPRQISQRAINNLSSLGGSDAIGAVSRQILQIFENFSYEKLGWGCHLYQGICEMRGVGSARGGYYIVKGGEGLPKIDVIGYNTQVDWAELWRRLQRISHVQEPIVEH